MASDDYLVSYDKNGVKTTHLNGSGTISAAMQYAIWDIATHSALVICKTPTDAETELRSLLNKRGNTGRAELAIVTVPVG